jgi:SNF2 family DNA or RNA helicase
MPEMFQQEVAPMLLRHTRHEPAVARCIPPKTPVVNQIIVEMDKQHRAYYERWLKQFSIWWAKKREEEDGKPSGATMNDLLVKLGYLINASTIPHFMLDDLTGGDGAEWSKIIGPFDSDQTVAKFQAATKLIQRNAERDEKTIAFCWRRKNLILGRTWCANQNPQIRSLMIDGTVSNQIKEGSNRSEKQERVNRFRYQDYKVLWAGIQTMKEGFNIPEANHGIFLDYTWEPADWQQALARMLRPAQKRTVYATFMCHKGTVDEYIAALVQLKARSADEGVDYQSFSDFNSSMIPDFKMYADAIVDGTEDVMRTKMWSAVEKLRQELEDEDI